VVEFGNALRVGSSASAEPLERSLRRLIAAAQARADAELAVEFDRGQEEVLEEAQFVAIEIVAGRPSLRGIVAQVAEQSADVGPVLLLDVSVVVLFVGTAARELDVMRLAVAPEMRMEELAAVVGVDAAQRERQRPAHLVESVADRLLALAEQGSRLSPGGVDVGEVERMAEVTGGRRAGVGDQIDLPEAGFLHVPAAGLDGDMVLQQDTGLGASIETTAQGALVSRQAIVDGARADAEQLALHIRGEPETAADPGHPLRQQRLQAHRPGVICRDPDGFQDGQQLRRVAASARAARGRLLQLRRRAVQQPDGILAVVAAVGAELVQNAPLLAGSGWLISRVDSSQVIVP